MFIFKLGKDYRPWGGKIGVYEGFGGKKSLLRHWKGKRETNEYLDDKSIGFFFSFLIVLDVIGLDSGKLLR